MKIAQMRSQGKEASERHRGDKFCHPYVIHETLKNRFLVKN